LPCGALGVLWQPSWLSPNRHNKLGKLNYLSKCTTKTKKWKKNRGNQLAAIKPGVLAKPKNCFLEKN